MYFLSEFAKIIMNILRRADYKKHKYIIWLAKNKYPNLSDDVEKVFNNYETNLQILEVYEKKEQENQLLNYTPKLTPNNKPIFRKVSPCTPYSPQFETTNKTVINPHFKERENTNKDLPKPMNNHSNSDTDDILLKLKGERLDCAKYVFEVSGKSLEVIKEECKNEIISRSSNLPVADFVHWSKRKEWNVKEAVALILGIEPRKIKHETFLIWADEWQKDNFFYSETIKRYKDIFENAIEDFQFKSYPGMSEEKIKKRVILSLAGEFKCTSIEFLQWANNMEYEPPSVLIDLAEKYTGRKIITVDAYESLRKENEQLSIKVDEIEKKMAEIESMQLPRLDKNSEFYSEELAIAIEAYLAVIKEPADTKSPKQRVLRFLEKKYPSLVKNAKERIATMCNWQPKGGATPTPVSQKSKKT